MSHVTLHIDMRAVAAGVAVLVPLQLLAGSVSFQSGPTVGAQGNAALYDFANGTVADAEQVNSNFDAVATAINDNDTRITTLADNVAVDGAGYVSLPNQPLASYRVRRSSSSEGRYDIETVLLDNVSAVDDVANVWTAPADGAYLVTGTWNTGNIPNGHRSVLRIRKNGVQVGQTVMDYQGATTDNIGGGFGHIETLEQGDEIEIYGSITSQSVVAVVNILKVL
jgi:hypothetical protein